MPDWTGKWAGGRYYERAGRRVYFIERRRFGVHYTISLVAIDDAEAESQLAAFEADPVGFKAQARLRRLAARQPPEPASLRITSARIKELIDNQRERGLATEHIYATELYLKQWGEAFAGRDVESITVPECDALLRRWKTAERSRIVALKSFCTYYAHPRRGRLDPARNPAALLDVPKARTAKFVAPRNYTMAEVERAYAATDSQVQRDVMRIAATTGLHTTEIERFAQGVGWLVPVEPEMGQGIAGVIWVRHKSGGAHPNSLDAASYAAAERIQARGRIPDKQKRQEYCHRLARRLSAELGEPARPVLYGALRHCFVTWARSCGGHVVTPKNFGVPLDVIRDAIGHKNSLTTRRYDGTEVPPMIVSPVRLAHPRDPPIAWPSDVSPSAPGGMTPSGGTHDGPRNTRLDSRCRL